MGLIGFIKFFRKLQAVLGTLSAIALLTMIIVILLQTFTRFVIFYSLPWSEELSRYLFVAMILLGFNVAISEGNLIRIDIIDNYMNGKKKLFLQYIRIFSAIFVNIIYIYSAYHLMNLGSYQLSPAMQIPMYFIYSVILIGFIFSLVSLIIEALNLSTDNMLKE
ncbi:TRAP transporter small permease [Gallibacterium genomosp. 3]|uniref:TRAP transporter small permease n=1 Tax=Gallibacterium genomosp. 3 TaxID=505345 RepID=UPI0008027AFB|nr:TRAP transporter small permease [Gallibacterium genomosp. 3]